MKMLKYN